MISLLLSSSWWLPARSELADQRTPVFGPTLVLCGLRLDSVRIFVQVSDTMVFRPEDPFLNPQSLISNLSSTLEMDRAATYASQWTSGRSEW